MLFFVELPEDEVAVLSRSALARTERYDLNYGFAFPGDTKASIAIEEAKPLKEQTTDRNPTYAWINEELAKAKSDYSALQARAVATQAIVGVYQAKAHQLEESGLVQQDLLREAKANEDNYLLYLHKREEARIEEALDRTRILNVAIVQQPSVPVAPVRSAAIFSLAGLLLVFVLSKELPIQNKRAVGRPQDIADLETLES